MNLLCVADNAEEVLKKMADYRFVDAQKWVEPSWQTAERSHESA